MTLERILFENKRGAVPFPYPEAESTDFAWFIFGNVLLCHDKIERCVFLFLGLKGVQQRNEYLIYTIASSRTYLPHMPSKSRCNMRVTLNVVWEQREVNAFTASVPSIAVGVETGAKSKPRFMDTLA